MFSALRGLTALFRGAGGGGFGATCMVYSDDTPALIKAFALASTAIFGARVQVCNGTADEVEINAAMGAIPLGGRVLLSEGTFHIADPIVVPANGITLMGFDSSTIIDGDLLATGEHGVEISGMTDVTLRDFAIQTEDGGGKTCHCIFVEDGANRLSIDSVEIIASDADGIHIEGTTILDCQIRHCAIHDCDGIGIGVAMDNANTALRFHILDNFIYSNGVGLRFFSPGTSQYCLVEGNTVYLNGAEGIYTNYYNDGAIDDNVVVANVSWGIRLRNSGHTVVEDNDCSINGNDNIMLEDSLLCDVAGNTCVGAVQEDTADGIQIDAGSTDCLIVGNHCCGNARYGIHLLGARASAVGNFSHENEHHGILCGAASMVIDGNYVYDNSQDVAATYHGIHVTNAGNDSLLVGNYCDSPGDSQEDGIHIAGTNSRCSLVGNWCSNGMGSGIYLTGCTDHQVHGNYCYNNDDYGIELNGCTRVHVKDNALVGNDTAEYLENACTDTAIPEIWAPVGDPDAMKGYRRVKTWTNNADTATYCTLQIPMDFQQFVSAVAVVIPGADGNMVWSANTSFGKICAGQQENAHTDTVAQNTRAVTNNELECFDLADAFTDLDLGDNVGVQVNRVGTAGADTSEADAYAVGVRLRYV